MLEDNAHRIAFFKQALGQHKLTVCRHARSAIRALKETSFDIVFLDHDLRSEIVDPSDENSGSEVARFIIDHGIVCGCIILHTENRVGQESMEEILPESQSIPYNRLKKLGLQAIVKQIADLDK